jgi:alpha-glucosidase
MNACRLLLLSGLFVGGIAAAGDEETRLDSPDGNVKLAVTSGASGLKYRVILRAADVITPSPMGMRLDGVDLGSGVRIDRIERETKRESYAVRGVHSLAHNDYNGAKFFLTTPGGTAFNLEARVFNDGVAFRFVVPGNGLARIPDAASAFILPPRSTVWYYGLSLHYEGVYSKKDVSEIKAGEWAAPPVTFRLPDDAGYGSITEAALTDYAGMALKADGHRGFTEQLGHAQPVVHPKDVETARRITQPASITGTITTPWRVVLVGKDLNTLVNNDVITNLCPPPDRELFPLGLTADWLKPGRAVWRHHDGGGTELQDFKEFTRGAGELGFEYNLIEHWSKWTDNEIREIVDYSRRYSVRILFWIRSRSIWNAQERRDVFRRLHNLGVAGVKVDFIDNEAKESVDFYQFCLKDAAEFQLLVNFHGANKPTGESRTWPNELTREAIWGMEQELQPLWAEHDATLPFTRLLAGPADFTPVMFNEMRRETSWAHQIATAAVLTSPLLVYGANPKNMLGNPAVEMIKSIPSVWDETVVLPPSAIGDVAVFARRRGDVWFLTVLNGPQAKQIRIGLSFLGRGSYTANIVRDQRDNSGAVEMERTTKDAGQSVSLSLQPGGGFIARFAK